MSLLNRVRSAVAQDNGELRVLAASGQLGYGVPAETFAAGLKRRPHFIGADMGSIDPGPYYLGSGRMATSESGTLRDLKLLLSGAQQIGVPLIIGSAGTAGAGPHLEATLELVRRAADEEGLSFTLASLPADMPRDWLADAIQSGRTRPLGKIDDLAPGDVEKAAQIVAQIGMEPLLRAIDEDVEVVVMGRACDTAIYAAVPFALGFARGPAMHMAKIIECGSLCCVPGGRDPILGTLKGDSFTLDSMNPVRHATPVSVAAHALYEQADPTIVVEPEGTLDLSRARYEAVDKHRTRVSGSLWRDAEQLTLKIEGVEHLGERALMIAASADPRFIASIDSNLAEVEKAVRSMNPERPEAPYSIHFRVYGTGVLPAAANVTRGQPTEICILAECVAATSDEARSVAGSVKQYLLHHGFEGRLSTSGNLAFPITPPELDAGAAYRFSMHHIVDVEATDLPRLFPVRTEHVGDGA